MNLNDKELFQQDNNFYEKLDSHISEAIKEWLKTPENTDGRTP